MKDIKKILHALYNLHKNSAVTQIVVATVGEKNKVIEERIHNQIQDDIVTE